MSERKHRVRKYFSPMGIEKAQPAIIDELAFVKNKCSNNARKVWSGEEIICLDLWIDKHYHDRHLHGDESGKREGIDPDLVESLVRKSLKYLILYSCMIKGFKFISYQDSAEPPARILLQEENNGCMLNVVIEPHFVELTKFEVTIKTAMCTDDFRIADGQYVIEFQGETSILKRKENKTLKEIFAF